MDGSSNVCRNGRNCGSEGCNKVSSLWSVFVSALIYLPYVVVLQGALVCVYLLLMFFFWGGGAVDAVASFVAGVCGSLESD